jgi:hypothetical protein
MTKSQQLRVFLCHSSRDKPGVQRIYDRLAGLEGVDPWLDEQKLLPGQDWDAEIRKAVRGSHVVLVCLSETSTTKEGYVQKEIRQSLDVADEKPDGTIFIIPIRLENCDVPERLRRWQWVDWFRDDGFERLHTALRARAGSVGIEISNAPGRLIYDSNHEQPAFSSWSFYSTSRSFRGFRTESAPDVGVYCVIESFGTESVGLNKSFNVVAGAVEFDYRVLAGGSSKQNIVFYAIPMQETGIGRTGLIEVGANVEDDPRNPKSPYRVRISPPLRQLHAGWCHLRLEFDFRCVPNAFYCIFGPRVNEGCTETGPAAVAIASVRLYVSR